ncbi:MAG: hypothetical protein ABL974_05340 [Prosthecobacter sp.]
MADEDFERHVFVNCPYDDKYRPLQRALIFVLMRLGYMPCLAAQISNSGQMRMEKIRQQIRECRHSIHDLSLVIAEKKNAIARMNMPYELGLDLGALWYGGPLLDTKVLLVLENKRGSVKKALSDHAGFDLRHHEGQVDLLLREVRAHFYAHLSSHPSGIRPDFPTHDELLADWPLFLTWLQKRPDGSLRSESELQHMEVAEYKDKVREWLEAGKAASQSQSPAYDLIREHVSGLFDHFIQQSITPWAFFNTNGISIDLPYGRKIRLSACEYSGSARIVFWEGFPKPFIQQISQKAFDWTRRLCQEQKLPPSIPLHETAAFLENGLDRSLAKMVEIDQGLRGKGVPSSVPRYTPTHEHTPLKRIIDDRLKAELRLAGR